MGGQGRVLVGTEGRNAGGGRAADAHGGTGGCTALSRSHCGPLASPALPVLLPSGTCCSCNAKSCSPQIRPSQGPGGERQPKARLVVKKLLLNLSCSLGGPAAVGWCKGAAEDGDGDGRSLAMRGDAPRWSPVWEDAAEPPLSPQAEWRAASTNVSFFETFCSTGQHAFNASRETCTVMLSSGEPRSQHWAVAAIVHREYDPALRTAGWGGCWGLQRGDGA